MTGSAENLQISGIVCSAKRLWSDVINVPELTRTDFGCAGFALAFGFKEEIEPRLGR